MLKLIIGLVLGISVGAMAQTTLCATDECVKRNPIGTFDLRSMPQITSKAFVRAGGEDESGIGRPIRMDTKGRVIAKCDLEP